MADEIYNIRIEGFDKAANDIVKLEVELKKLNEERKAAMKLGKDEKDLTEEQAAEAARLTKEITKLTQEKQDATKTLKAGNTVLVAQNNAYDKLATTLNEARKEYKNLAAVGKENTEEGKKLLANITQMDTKVKQIDASVGQHQRNVGNYSDALKGLGGGIGGAIEGVKGFNTALKANPILAVITLVMGLVSWLKTLQPVADFIKETLGGLNAVFAVLIERVKMLISGDFGGAFRNIASDITAAAKAGVEYEKVLKRISDAQMIQNILNSEASKQIAVLEAQFKDRSKSYEERLEIANQIAKIETENFEKQQQILKETLRNESEKVKILLKTRGVNIELLKTTEDLVKAAQDYALQDEDFKNLVKAQTDLNDAERESLELTERIGARRNVIDQQREEAMQRQAEMTAKQLQKESELMEKMAANMAKILEEIIAGEEAIGKVGIERDIAFEERMQREYEQQIARQKAYTEAQNFISQFRTQTVFKQLDAEQAKIDELLRKKLITEAQYAEASKTIQSDRWNASLTLATGIIGQIGELLGKETKAGKLAASAATAINTYQSIMKTLAVYGWTPLGIASMAATAAMGIQQIAKINKTPDKFAKGGIIGGNSHAAGGTTFAGSDGSVFEAERGELLAIVNKRDTELISQLGAINGIHGRKFAAGGIVTPQVPESMMAVQELAAQIRDQRVYVLESDITNKQRHVRVIESAGEL